MYPLPEVVPISELRTRQKELLEMISEVPVLLTEHGRAVAVLLGPEFYNRMFEEFEDLWLELDAAEARAKDAPGTDFEGYLAGRGDHMRDPSGE